MLTIWFARKHCPDCGFRAPRWHGVTGGRFAQRLSAAARGVVIMNFRRRSGTRRMVREWKSRYRSMRGEGTRIFAMLLRYNFRLTAHPTCERGILEKSAV